MAKQGLTLTTKVTFSFKKLRQNWEKNIMPKLTNLSGKDTAEKWKENIFTSQGASGKLEPLSAATLGEREKKGISSKKPLFETGRLHDSIVGKGNTVSYMAYGKKHQEGFSTVWKGKERTIPSRPWQTPPSISEKSMDKVRKLIREAFSLKTPKTIGKVSV
tara:strand:+ start:243 stop:725 length:483 start_codon:yes stop_codon:yes gene_type:complete